MTWTAWPTFTDGVTVSAANLNALSSNMAYLYDVINATNHPFAAIRTEGDSIDFNPANVVWYIRHTHRYLHFRVEYDDISQFRVYYNYPAYSTWIYDADPGSGTPVSVDLTPLSLTVGNWYPILFDIDVVAGSDTVHVQYAFESPTTDLYPEA